MSEIMLATTFDIDNLHLPAEISVKLDGVAADFYKTKNGWVCQSRQGKPLPSTGHILKFLNSGKFDSIPENTHVIGELTVAGVADFKDAGGIIRRKEADTRIQLNVYDMYQIGFENESYETRLDRVNKFLKLVGISGQRQLRGDSLSWSIVQRVPVCTVVHNKAQLQEHLMGVPKLMETSNMFEGFVIRTLRGPDSRYKLGKRSRGMMRYKPKPTVDLKVVRFEEATANKAITFLDEDFGIGDGLRAVGRIVCLYEGQEIGVGPGCLTHAERRDVWERYQEIGAGDITDRNLIAEVEYMLDNSYKALRQPIFKRWRTDKDEASEEA